MAPKRQDTCRVCGEPRIENSKGLALCTEHLREYRRGERARAEIVAPSQDPQYRRINEYHKIAMSQGATDDQAWWCAVAAEAECVTLGPKVFRPVRFIASELDWLRANAKTLQDLDARQWAAVRERETVTIDDGWTDEEGVA